VLSVKGLCDGLITHPEESYRLWCVVGCDHETSYARRLKPARGLKNKNPQWVVAPEKRNFLALVSYKDKYSVMCIFELVNICH